MRASAGVFAFLVVCVSAMRADPEGEVRAAVRALGEASGYAWESTVRGHVPAPPRAGVRIPLPRAMSGVRVEVQGRADHATYAELVVLPAWPTLPVQVPVRTYRKAPSTWVGFTPLGWLTLPEIAKAARTHPDDEVPFEGKSVRLSAIFSAVRNATARVTPVEEMEGLLADIARFTAEGGAIVGELKPAAAETLYHGPRLRRATSVEPVAGVVVFRLRDGVVTEFEYRLWPLAAPTSAGMGTPSPSVTGWKTTISSIGTTQVTPPREAFEKLEK